MRRAAPEDGIARLRQRQKAHRTSVLAVTGATALLLIGAVAFVVSRSAGNEDRDIGDRQPAPTTSVERPTSSAGASLPATTPSVAGAASPDVEWAARYLGVSAAPAVGQPVKIGWMHDMNDVAGNSAMEKSVEYLNENLGGIQGQPLGLVTCDTSQAGGAAECAEVLSANDEISAVITTSVVSDAVYSVIAEKKALMVTWHNFAGSLNSKLAIFGADGTAGFASMLSYVDHELGDAKNAVVLLSVAMPRPWDFIRSSPETNLTFVNVGPQASVGEVADAIASAVPDVAALDAIVTYGNGGPWCENLPAAKASLGISAQIVVMDVCAFSSRARTLAAFTDGRDDSSVPIASPAESVFNGVIAVSWGVHPIDRREIGLHVLDAVIGEDRSGGPYFDTAWTTFETLLTFVKIANGVESAQEPTADELRRAIGEFDGASILQFGPIACGRVDPGSLPSSGAAGCSQYAGVFRFVDGEWTVIADGRNGKLLGYNGIVDVDPTMFPPVE